MQGFFKEKLSKNLSPKILSINMVRYLGVNQLTTIHFRILLPPLQTLPLLLRQVQFDFLILV